MFWKAADQRHPSVDARDIRRSGWDVEEGGVVTPSVSNATVASRGQTCQVSRNFRESPEITPDLQVSRKCYKISRNLGNLSDLLFFSKKSLFLAYLKKMCVSTHEYH